MGIVAGFLVQNVLKYETIFCIRKLETSLHPSTANAMEVHVFKTRAAVLYHHRKVILDTDKTRTARVSNYFKNDQYIL